MTAVRKAVRKISPAQHGLGDFVAKHRRTERQIAAGQSLCEADEIGIQAPKVTGEPVAHTPEGGNHFVGHKQDLVFPAELSQSGKVASRRDDYPARSLDRFSKERRDRVRALLHNYP